MKRTILHVDMDAFFASVEQRDNPELQGKVVVVGAPPDQRGVVAAASYEARRYGIHSAMPSREAGKRCPDAVFVPPNLTRYKEVSDQIVVILEQFTPLVEPLSIDEAFLDVTGGRALFGTGEETARKIKTRIQQETGLIASVGVAGNKFLAKLASDLEKPDGLTVVPDEPEAIKAFLAPLPVKRLWGVGKVMQQTLADIGIHTVADLQQASPKKLASLIGASLAGHLLALANGQDERELELEREEKSISREHTYLEDCSEPERLERTLSTLVEDVGSSLRGVGKYAGIAHLKLRWQGFKTITRQRPFPRPSADDVTLRHMALELFRAESLIKPVRLIGFGVSRLATERDEPQMDLFSSEGDDQEKRERLSTAVDALRAKFGDKLFRADTHQS